MRVLALLVSLFVLPLVVNAQELLPDSSLKKQSTYTNLAQALSEPDKVYKLNLTKQGLKSIPEDIFKLTNLQVLILSNNSIDAIPAGIANLKNLQVLDLSKNKLIKLGPHIGSLPNLEELSLYKNDIDTLPTQMEKLVKLRKLDLWETELYHIPEELKALKNLESLDLRGVLFNDETQHNIMDIFPKAKIYFSPSCTCKF